jgi:hypothetical protein
MKAHENSLNDLIDYIKRNHSDYDEIVRLYAIQLMDSAECDNYVRDRVRGILTDFEIDGDSFGVPTIEDIVNDLVEKILALENSNCK